MDKNKHKNYKKLFYSIIIVLVHIGYVLMIGSLAYGIGEVGNKASASFIIGIGLVFYAFVAWIIILNLEN